MNDQLIIAITSWPKRINALPYCLTNIIQNKVGSKIVLVLSKEEFPNKEQDLSQHLLNVIQAGDIEILWDRGNIKSHKKLLPVIEKYPDNPILVLDDDKIYPKFMILDFLKDHHSHPESIIIGGAYFNLIPKNNKIICENPSEKLKNILQPGQEVTIQKPANGAFGMLFPPHTFTREEFFNRQLMMKLSPNDDESWHYLFCVLEDRPMRALSTIYDNVQNIANTQEVGLCSLYGPDDYNEIHSRFILYFPEYYKKITKLYQKYLSNKN